MEAEILNEPAVYAELRALREEVRTMRTALDNLVLAVRLPERTKYTVLQACRRLGVGRSKLYELFREERLAYVTEGSRRYVTEAACQHYEATERERARVARYETAV